MPHIHAIYRYPIKGLSPEPLTRTALAPGETVPGDRLYAIENGPSGFDPVAQPYLSKAHFLMLMKNERLAGLRTAFDHDTHTLTIHSTSPWRGEAGAQPVRRSVEHEGGSAPGGGQSTDQIIRGDLRTKEGRLAIEAFFRRFMPKELRGPPKVLHAPGHSFSDVARKVVSIINLASVAAIEDMIGAPVNPLRFRGNVYVEGWKAWSELDLVGKELIIAPPPEGGRTARNPSAEARSAKADARRVGVSASAPARLKIVKRIVRCAATNVDPDTGLRDLEVPKALLRNLGHADCGIYAEVVGRGEIAAGDEVEIA
jgi:uncharacterized protein